MSNHLSAWTAPHVSSHGNDIPYTEPALVHPFCGRVGIPDDEYQLDGAPFCRTASATSPSWIEHDAAAANVDGRAVAVSGSKRLAG